jgi:hypothetical protein
MRKLAGPGWKTFTEAWLLLLMRSAPGSSKSRVPGAIGWGGISFSAMRIKSAIASANGDT